jgi:hypothetical protein
MRFSIRMVVETGEPCDVANALFALVTRERVKAGRGPMTDDSKRLVKQAAAIVARAIAEKESE